MCSVIFLKKNLSGFLEKKLQYCLASTFIYFNLRKPLKIFIFTFNLSVDTLVITLNEMIWQQVHKFIQVYYARYTTTQPTVCIYCKKDK